MPAPLVEAAPRSSAQAIKCSYLICLIGDPGWIRTSDLQLRRLSRAIAFTEEFRSMSRPCRDHALSTAASSFFIASRSPSASAKRCPYRSKVMVIEACPMTA